MTQAERAQAFLAMHTQGDLLVLPTAWDVPSARIFAAAGAGAVGIGSMGVAATFGYPDVQVIPFEDMLDAVERIAASVDVPVSADMEAGWGETADEVAAAMQRVLALGIVGINLEDGTGVPEHPVIPAEEHADRVRAVRQMADASGVHLVINARTDVFLRQVGPESERLVEAIRRGNVYRAAGADCVFVPGGLSRETIRELCREIDAPVNVVANPAISVPVVPDIPELTDLGVRRVSIGSGAARAAFALTRRMANELLRDGVYTTMRAELERPGASEAYRAVIGDSGRMN